MQVDPFTKFEKDWGLLTAGTKDRFNSMTIGWGALGTVWNRDALTVYVRPDRYTWQFMKDSEYFTVSFFPESCREALLLMGRLSGRDGDKAAAAGLTPRSLPEGVTFEEARETFVCKKIYMAPMAYEDVPPVAQRIYQNGIKPHWIIMGEVVDYLT
jgi:Conserved protein/domain typically associated with flavoprotein oxygenases, DIM6/NTAB family